MAEKPSRDVGEEEEISMNRRTIIQGLLAGTVLGALPAFPAPMQDEGPDGPWAEGWRERAYRLVFRIPYSTVREISYEKRFRDGISQRPDYLDGIVARYNFLCEDALEFRLLHPKCEISREGIIEYAKQLGCTEVEVEIDFDCDCYWVYFR